MSLDIPQRFTDDPWPLIEPQSCTEIANQFSGLFDTHKNDFKNFAKNIVRLSEAYATPFKVTVNQSPGKIDYMVFCGDTKRLVWVAPLFKKYSPIRNNKWRSMLGLDFTNKTYH